MDRQLPQVAASDALILASSGSGWLLDVREQPEWDRGHSPLATLVPMTQLQDRIGELPGDRRLLVICHSGRRSATVVGALVGAGYDAVNVAGGMLAWDAAGGDLVAVGPETPRVD